MIEEMKKQKLLFIDKEQFGYLTDLYKWCEYLRDEYNITVVSMDIHRSKLELPGVRVKYVPVQSWMNRTFRGILFILYSLFNAFFFNGKIFVVYFPQCSILKKILFWKKMHVDVRTLWVSKDERCRKNYDDRLIKECGCFDSFSAISDGVAKKIGIPEYDMIPLGSDVISTVPKDYENEIRLLYVGTLNNRDMEKTIVGLKLFVEKHPDIHVSYDLVGDGQPGLLNKLIDIAEESGISNYITFHGFVPQTQTGPFFDRCNVGVSFIPITSYYDYQPPTKTFEYVMSGLFCVATGTISNKEIINSDNGVIISDTPEGFCHGLEEYWNRRSDVNESVLRASLSEYKWDNIISRYVLPVIKK